jgi:hypothetical protein
MAGAAHSGSQLRVGPLVQTQVLEHGGGQAGGVPLRAQDHDRLVVTLDLGDPVGAGRAKAPLQHVAFEDDRARDLALLCALAAGRMSTRRPPLAAMAAAW